MQLLNAQIHTTKSQRTQSLHPSTKHFVERLTLSHTATKQTIHITRYALCSIVKIEIDKNINKTNLENKEKY